VTTPPPSIAETPTPPGAPEARFRGEIGQISRHSAVFFAGTMFTAAAGYLFKIYLARMLGAGALGIYALGMTIVGFFGLFNGLGLPQAAVRFVAAYVATQQYERLHVFLRRTIGLLLIANVVLVGLMLALTPWLARHVYQTPDLTPYVPYFAAILVFGAFSTFFGLTLAGFKDVARRTVIINFIASPLNILIGALLIAAGMGLRGYLLGQIASGGIAVLFLIASAWKLMPIPARHSPSQAAELESEVLNFSVVVFGVSVLEFLLAQTDKIVMGAFLNVREVGIYAVAASLITFVPVALQSVNQIFSPTIADLHARGERMLLGRIFQTLTKWIIGLTMPLAFVMMVYSKPLMRLFGPAFEIGWTVLIIGTLGQLINAGVGSVGYLLLMSGNQKRLLRVQTMMAIFLVVMTLALVRPFGIIGVAVASALTNGLTNYLCLKEVGIALQITPYNRTYLRLIAPTVASFAVIAILRVLGGMVQAQWLMIGVALVSAYLTFCGLSLMIGLDSDDKMILEAIKRRLLSARRA
jgi:O-antigen/teichoic acid export membrane protein